MNSTKNEPRISEQSIRGGGAINNPNGEGDKNKSLLNLN